MLERLDQHFEVLLEALEVLLRVFGKHQLTEELEFADLRVGGSAQGQTLASRLELLNLEDLPGVFEGGLEGLLQRYVLAGKGKIVQGPGEEGGFADDVVEPEHLVRQEGLRVSNKSDQREETLPRVLDAHLLGDQIDSVHLFRFLNFLCF